MCNEGEAELCGKMLRGDLADIELVFQRWQLKPKIRTNGVIPSAPFVFNIPRGVAGASGLMLK
jgi:hypothetical protein